MKQAAELQDGEYFVHTYAQTTVCQVIRQVCVGGGDTGSLDYVETQEVGHLENDKVVLTTRRSFEKCNPYAPVIQVTP